MCSLPRLILVLAVLSAGVCSCSADDQDEDGAVTHAPDEGGHDQDHDQGHDQGHNQGNNQGHDQGHGQGHNQGNNQGHDQGHEGGGDFYTRVVAELARDLSDVHARLEECSNTPQDCNKPIDEDRLVSHVSLIEYGQIRCFENSFTPADTNSGMEGLSSPSGHELAFTDTCNNMQKLSKCLKDAYARLQPCVCDVEIEVFSIIPIAIMDVMKKECTKNKGKIDGLKNNGGLDFWKQHVNALGQCINDAFGRPSPSWAKVDQFNSDTLGHLLISRYDGVKGLKRCLADVGKGKDPTVKYLESLTGLLLEEMHCVKDNRNTLAPCKKVVKNSAGGSRPGFQHGLGLAAFWLVLAWLNNARMLS